MTVAALCHFTTMTPQERTGLAELVASLRTSMKRSFLHISEKVTMVKDYYSMMIDDAYHPHAHAHAPAPAHAHAPRTCTFVNHLSARRFGQ